ncbi:MAG: hypothetical protein AAB300_04730, partial [Nitrospirota bacterium]
LDPAHLERERRTKQEGQHLAENELRNKIGWVESAQTKSDNLEETKCLIKIKAVDSLICLQQ